MFSSDFKKVLPYALVVFLGFVGFSMPLPILPKMFLDPEIGILPNTYSVQVKTFLLGLIMSAYPAGQLIGSPLLGKCSDYWGRKKVILWSLMGCMVGYIMTALAARTSSVTAMFCGLFFTGLCEGNIAIAQSVVADLAGPKGKKKKTIYFGWINLFVCFAFIIGPILGGKFSDSAVISWFTFSTPFWIAALMTLIGMGIVIRFSQETKISSQGVQVESYWESFKKGLSQSILRKMYLVNFFLALGYFAYFRYLPVYLQCKFSFSSALIGYSIAYGAVAYALSAFFLLKPLSHLVTPQKAVGFFAAFLAIAMLVVLIPNASWSILITTVATNVCLAVVMTYGSVIVSNVAAPSFQGQALGILTSVQVLAETLTGIGGGVLAGYFISLPILIGSIMLLIASLFLFAFRKEKEDDIPESLN
jgi:MFS transporter, DHA1 family, tetracycline resistance protein